MRLRKKRLYDAMLPATPCTKGMREKVLEVAGREEASIAEIQRAAYSLFLSWIDSKTIGSGIKTSNLTSWIREMEKDG